MKKNRMFADVAFCIENIENQEGIFFLDGETVTMKEAIKRFPNIQAIIESDCEDLVTELTHYLKNL